MTGGNAGPWPSSGISKGAVVWGPLRVPYDGSLVHRVGGRGTHLYGGKGTFGKQAKQKVLGSLGTWGISLWLLWQLLHSLFKTTSHAHWSNSPQYYSYVRLSLEWSCPGSNQTCVVSKPLISIKSAASGVCYSDERVIHNMLILLILKWASSTTITQVEYTEIYFWEQGHSSNSK